MCVYHHVHDRTVRHMTHRSVSPAATRAAAMPFSRAVRVTRHGSQPANVSGLGDATSDAKAQMDADAAAYSAVQAVSKPEPQTLWGSIASTFAAAGNTVVQGAATRVANRLTGTSATPLTR